MSPSLSPEGVPISVRYNLVAAQSVERIAALSDGVFAVAMTLLVLDLKAPAEAAVHGDADLARALLAIAPRLLVYAMSFLTLGIFWVGQQTQLNHLARADRDVAWCNLTFLFAVTLMPFSTSLMADFISLRLALLLYWANILFLGVVMLASWRYVLRTKLLREDAPAGLAQAMTRRIVIAQALYAVGAALCVFGTYWSLGFIVLVQLNYALAPRIGVLQRI